MLFTLITLRGLEDGSIDRTFRRWQVVRPKVGSRFTTKIGLVEVTKIEKVREEKLTPTDAKRSGFADLDALLKWTRAKGEGDLYRIKIKLAGPDPRIALRQQDALEPGDLATLDTKLGRMDRAADQPWTRQTLDLIGRRPAVVSTELAAELGLPRPDFKIRVRRLKALGLTESLEVGYRLSPRGEAYLRQR
jgi:hypothetical protein